MSGLRSFARVGAVAAGLTGLALTVPTLAASKDRCCEVAADAPGVSSAGTPVTLDIEVARNGKGCTPTRRTVSVALDGLRARHVRVERVTAGVPLVLVETAANGTVTALDPLADATLICGDATAAARYRITFADEAPTGEARLDVAVSSPAGKPLGNATETVVVAGAVALPPPDEEEEEPPAEEEEPPLEEEPEPTPSEPMPSEPTEAPSTPEAPPTTEAPAYEESPGPAGGDEPAATEPPALSQSDRLAGGPSAPLIGAGLALAAAAVLAVGTLGWWYRRRTPADPTDLDGPTVAVTSAGG
ncbi:hypothetical protein [Phytohabitans aurantiacus]|uniref:Uncharacterized protein n=1 Tax=Phytohabitans aurantiacus TaxID=3016789 RepID=A0ABQ5QWV6_9ACTN|nr:hypothetical protein [Phytohabitans aurantiacus]GLH97815.1 hypothetical protein Pa4123_30900 [Phytohabitans aurantiacus]